MTTKLLKKTHCYSTVTAVLKIWISWNNLKCETRTINDFPMYVKALKKNRCDTSITI